MKKTKFNDFLEKIEKVKLHNRIIIASIVIATIYVLVSGFYYINKYIKLGEINSGQFLEVLSNDLKLNIAVFVVTFIISFLFIYIQNKFAINIIKKLGKKENKKVGKIPNKSIALLFALITAFLAMHALSSNLMEYLNTISFMEKDSIFNKDISYYIMQRPFIFSFTKFLAGFLIATTLYIIGYYIASFGFYFDGINKKNLDNSAYKIHIIINIVMFLAINIFETIFYKESILYTSLNVSSNSLFNSLVGSGFTDVAIKLKYFTILPIILAIFVVVALILLKKKKYKKILLIPLAYLGITTLVYVVTGAVQAIYVKPNELAVEKKYVQYHLDNTKKAYGIDMRNVPVNLDTTFSDTDIEKYKNVIDNIDISENKLKQESLNSVKDSMYRHPDIDITSKKIDSKNTLTYLTAKEIDSEKVGKLDYISKNIKYTYGEDILAYVPNVAKNQLEDVTESIVSPTQKIYYGELTTLDAIVNSSGMFQDGSEETIEVNYKGKNGLSMNKMNRLNIAIKNLDINAILSNYINADSKYLTTRNIIERIQTVLPAMLIDKDPYLVLDETGKAYYVVDIYTVAQNYPYSKKTNITKQDFHLAKPKVDLGSVNYIRNSIKVIVDPYDGTLNIYNTDKTDPIAISYKKRYPNMFTKTEGNALYEDLEEDFKYPKMLKDKQIEILKEYYVEHAENFYKNEKFLQLPTYLDENNNKIPLKSYYTFAKLLDNEEEELVLMQPVAYNSEDLAGYFIGNVENGKNKLEFYTFNNTNKVLGTLQLDQQITTQNDILDEKLKSVIAKRNKITKKTMLIPMDNKMLYMQIYYSTSIDFVSEPVIEQVVISDGKKISIDKNIYTALNKLVKLGEEQYISEEFLSEDISANIEQVIKTYKYMRDTMKHGDLEMFAREMQNLEEEMKKLEIKYEDKKKSNEDSKVAD
ncbi:MAG: UPF0182 family protein [Clostridia bacterium]